MELIFFVTPLSLPFSFVVLIRFALIGTTSKYTWVNTLSYHWFFFFLILILKDIDTLFFTEYFSIGSLVYNKKTPSLAHFDVSQSNEGRLPKSMTNTWLIKLADKNMNFDLFKQVRRLLHWPQRYWSQYINSTGWGHSHHEIFLCQSRGGQLRWSRHTVTESEQ